MTLKKVTVKDDQTLYDIALQEYGSVEGVIQLATDNNLSLDDEIQAGDVLKVNTDLIIDQTVVNYFQNEADAPAGKGSSLEGLISAFSDGFKQNAIK